MTCILKHRYVTVADRINKEQRILHKLLIQTVYNIQIRRTLTNMMFEHDLVTCTSMSCSKMQMLIFLHSHIFGQKLFAMT